jgi:serine protease Do
MNNKKQFFLIVMLASFLGGVMSLFGYKYFVTEKTYESIEKSQRAHFTNYLADTSIVVPDGLNFIYAADVVRPSVVHIRTYYEAKGAAQNLQGSPFDEMLKDYFGDRLNTPDGSDRYNQGRQQEASGSGVILSEDGYIVTNNHVIDRADKIEVVLNDKRSYIAKLIGTDPTTDLSLIKIEEKGLSYVKYGNSDNVKIGEWVLAVGNPFNLTSTVTAGIVSAKARNINILRDKDNMAIESFIQTDAVVNPGNSGGALVNLKGDLIGINTAIASPTGSYTGYSFAVPVTLVKKVMDDLLKYGQVQRALLGVTILDISAAVAKEKDIHNINGVYVAGVNEGSAAEKAGLKEGDVITHINGILVNSASELQEIVGRNRPGDKVKVSYIRNDKPYEIEATLKNKSGNTDLIKRDDSAVKSILGAEFSKPLKQELDKLKLKGGAKVINLAPGKFRDAGIREGFIITRIDKTIVESPEAAQDLLKDSSGEGHLLEGYYPNGEKRYYGIGW